MNVLSFSHTIVSAASSAHFPSAAQVNPALADAHVSFPPGTVLDLPEDEASHLLEIGCAVEWIPNEHGADPASILRAMNRPHMQSPQQVSGFHHG